MTQLKADWLRSEIEKLEARQEEIKEESRCAYGVIVLSDESIGAIEALTSIITRYKEELKVLESK